jgi:hypothetical protein
MFMQAIINVIKGYLRMTKKTDTAVAIRATASIAAQAWQRLEAAATKAMANDHAAPAMQLVADDRGITALIRDDHGTTVTVQGGKISVVVDGAQETE